MCFDVVAAGARLFRLDARVYFFAVNSNIFRRVNADSDLSTTHAEHGDLDLTSNGDGFADATGQYQHAIPLNWFRRYQYTNTPEMGLASPIIVDCTRRLGDSPTGRAIRPATLHPPWFRIVEPVYLRSAAAGQKRTFLRASRHMYENAQTTCMEAS
jgi:hypothetical protein